MCCTTRFGTIIRLTLPERYRLYGLPAGSLCAIRESEDAIRRLNIGMKQEVSLLDNTFVVGNDRVFSSIHPFATRVQGAFSHETVVIGFPVFVFFRRVSRHSHKLELMDRAMRLHRHHRFLRDSPWRRPESGQLSFLEHPSSS